MLGLGGNSLGIMMISNQKISIVSWCRRETSILECFQATWKGEKTGVWSGVLERSSWWVHGLVEKMALGKRMMWWDIPGSWTQSGSGLI